MTLEYINEIPDPMPEEKILVHNHVSPSPWIGFRGFRVWLATKTDEHAECPCWFAPQLGKHYRLSHQPPYEPNRASRCSVGFIRRWVTPKVSPRRKATGFKDRSLSRSKRL
jgi:hypothetical protein